MADGGKGVRWSCFYDGSSWDELLSAWKEGFGKLHCTFFLFIFLPQQYQSNPLCSTWVLLNLPSYHQRTVVYLFVWLYYVFALGWLSVQVNYFIYRIFNVYIKALLFVYKLELKKKEVLFLIPTFWRDNVWIYTCNTQDP